MSQNKNESRKFSEYDILKENTVRILRESQWSTDDILFDQKLSYEGRMLIVDAILLFNLYPLAILEIKTPIVELDSYIDQIFRYAEAANVPFAFLTDGLRILGGTTISKEIQVLNKFPTPHELLKRIGKSGEEGDPRFFPPSRKFVSWLPQIHSINRSLEAIISGKEDILIVMPTGSGKTYVAFQIIWKLLKSGYLKRILLLEAKEFLLNQTSQLFEEFGRDLNILTSENQKDFSGSLHLSTDTVFKSFYLKSNKSGDIQNYYDLIMFQEPDMMESFPWLMEQFKDTRKIAFTSGEMPGSKIIRFFGSPLVSYTLRDILEFSDVMKVPKGFRSIHLGDVAELSIGFVFSKELVKAETCNECINILKTQNLMVTGDIDIENSDKIFILKKQEKMMLQANDILLSRFVTGKKIKIAFIRETPKVQTTFSSSLIRIRVDSNFTNPINVFNFLSSDVGQLQILKYCIGTNLTYQRINVRDLRNTSIFIPEIKTVVSDINGEFSSVSRARIEIENEILPLLGELHQKTKNKSFHLIEEFEIIANRLHSLADTLSPPKLHQRVITEYPTPIALAYRRYYEARYNIYEKILRLRDLFESVAFFTYNIVLADTFQRLDPEKYYIEDKGARKAYNSYSMNQRMNFLSNIIEIAKKNDGKDLFIPELVETSIASQVKYLQKEFRNRFSHTATAAETQQEKTIIDFEPFVEEILSDLDFITTYRMVRIPNFYIKDGKLMRQLELYNSVSVNCIEEQLSSFNIKCMNADRNHLGLLNTEDEFLDLYPLYQLLASEETRHERHLCFFKQRKVMEQELEGESVQGVFPVKLEGLNVFRKLLRKSNGRRKV